MDYPLYPSSACRFNLVEFMMHDKDCSGTIDIDECMEILFRRFGKDSLESKVNAFMANDADKDATISFTEFLAMDRRNDTAGTMKHPGGLASSGGEEGVRVERRE